MKTDKLLLTEFPQLRKYIPIEENIKHGIDINNITIGSRHEIILKTKTGICFKRMAYEITNIIKSHNGCFLLNYIKKIIPGYSDIFSTHPEIKQYWSGKNIELKLDPMQLKSSSKVKAYFKCQCCGNEIETPKSISSFINGSRFAADVQNGS